MLRTRSIIILGILINIHAVIGQTFQKKYFVSNNVLTLPLDAVQRPDGNILVSNISLLPDSSTSVNVSCVGATGEVIWSTKLNTYFDGPYQDAFIPPMPIICTSDNSCIVEVAKRTDKMQRVLIKLGANGTIQWTKFIAHYAGLKDVLEYIDGRIYLIVSGIDDSNQPTCVMSLDENGGAIWEKTIIPNVWNGLEITGVKLSRVEGILLNFYELADTVPMIGHIARLKSNGDIVPLLSLPQTVIVGAEEHPDGRIFFLAQPFTFDGIGSPLLIGAAKNNQVQWVKRLNLPQLQYYGGLVNLSENNDALSISVRNGLLPEDRYFIPFDLNGNPGVGHLIHGFGFIKDFKNTQDGGFLSLTLENEQTIDNSFVLTKTNAEGIVDNCPAMPLCGLIARDTMLNSIPYTPWQMSPVSYVEPGTATQVVHALTYEDYCWPVTIQEANIVAPDTLACENESLYFSSLPGFSGTSMWNFPGGEPSAFNGSQPPEVVFPEAGVYQVQHILNQNGCLDTASIIVRIADSPAVLLPADTSLCMNETLVVGIQADPLVEYLWTDGEIGPFRIVDAPGTYVLQATNHDGCTATDSITFFAPQFPPDIWPADTFFCMGASLVINLGEAPGWQYEWADSPVNERSFNESGTYYFTAKSPEKCVFTDSLVVVQRSFPEVNINVSNNVCGPIMLLATGNSLQSYYWNTSESTPVITAHETGTYSVMASDGFCESSDSVQLQISACPDCFVFVPNIFKPAAGILSVQSGCVLSDFNFQIFDRWGNLLFESRDSGTAWDGTFQGRTLPTGVYAYRLQTTLFSGDTYYPFSKSGDITIVR